MSIHSKTRLLTHIVWSTHKRHKVIPRPLRIELHNYLRTYAGKHSICIINLYINADHVHVLIDMDPTQSVASTIKLLKGGSSRWLNLHDLIPGKFSWGRGYGAFSVSQSHVQRVIGYINYQEEHHRNKHFSEEFDALMQKHRVEQANR